MTQLKWSFDRLSYFCTGPKVSMMQKWRRNCNLIHRFLRAGRASFEQRISHDQHKHRFAPLSDVISASLNCTPRSGSAARTSRAFENLARLFSARTSLGCNPQWPRTDKYCPRSLTRQSSKNSIRRPIWPMCRSASSPVGPRATSCTNSSPGTGRRPASAAHGRRHEPAAPFVIALFIIDGGSRDAARRT